MQLNLLDNLDDDRRHRLVARGWQVIVAWGQTYWQRPADGAWLSFAEACRQLERLEDADGSDEK